MHPREAVEQILEIRRQLAASGRFRGFRSTAVGVTGALALAGAAVQSAVLTDATNQLQQFLLLWTSVAGLSVLVVGAAMVMRIRRLSSRLERDMALHAVETVAPSMVVGAWFSVVLLYVAPDQAWLLPGLWSILFSLSVFATRRFLSPQVGLVGAHYAIAGLACVLWGREGALAPWTMAITFGLGQLLAAVILFLTVEHDDDPA